jgi:hypothetical protein
MPEPTCPVCHFAVDKPDELGRHRSCGQHVDDRVVARPCSRCGSAMTARPDAPADDLVCTWCQRSDADKDPWPVIGPYTPGAA